MVREHNGISKAGAGRRKAYPRNDVGGVVHAKVAGPSWHLEEVRERPIACKPYRGQALWHCLVGLLLPREGLEATWEDPAGLCAEKLPIPLDTIMTPYNVV